jgi:hypothetical protein
MESKYELGRLMNIEKAMKADVAIMPHYVHTERCIKNLHLALDKYIRACAIYRNSDPDNREKKGIKFMADLHEVFAKYGVDFE